MHDTGNYVDIQYDEMVEETEKAWKVVIDNEVVWIPKFAVTYHDEQYQTFEMWEDMAIEKELV